MAPSLQKIDGPRKLLRINGDMMTECCCEEASGACSACDVAVSHFLVEFSEDAWDSCGFVRCLHGTPPVSGLIDKYEGCVWNAYTDADWFIQLKYNAVTTHWELRVYCDAGQVPSYLAFYGVIDEGDFVCSSTNAFVQLGGGGAVCVGATATVTFYD